MADLPAAFAADPVFTVAGQRIADLGRDCIGLAVEEDTDGLRTCSAQFLAAVPRQKPNADVVEYLDGKTIDLGTDIVVSVGPPGNEQTVFAGKISALEVVFDEGDSPHVALDAEDRLMLLRMTRRSATYTSVSDADLATAIAGKHGLTPDIAADGPTYALVAQLDESDLGFLRSRAALVGAEVWVTGTTLHFATRDKRRGPAVTLAAGKTLLTAAIRADLADQRSSVVVSGYDAQSRQTIDVSIDKAPVLAQIGGGRLGADVLTTAFGALPDQWSGLVPMRDQEARAWATAQVLIRARHFVRVTGTTAGTPELTVGARLTLQDVGAPFTGDGYYVTRVRQRWQRGAGGLRTHFEAERPTVNSTGGLG